MIDVVRQIANENTERAGTLRDQGQLQQAEQVLRSNSEYLYMNAGKYNSEELKQYGAQNSSDAATIQKPASWGVQRKAMRDSQSATRGQR